MKEIIWKPELHRFSSCKEFVEEFRLGASDLILTNEYIYQPYFRAMNLECAVLYQEQYGMGEPTDVMAEAILRDAAATGCNRVVAIGGGTVIDIAKVLAVGGGSVIDSAKAIAMGVCNDGDVWDFFATGKPIEAALPVATILTLPATGSEASDGTVVTNEEAQLKLPYGDIILRPVFSIMNPELYFTLPENQIANGVCDMMSHIMERYFTNTTHTDVTDGLCESVLRTIMNNARILKRDHTNYDAWAEVALAGTVAHNGLLGLGREEDWGCHNMEHELSAIYDVAHGAGLAVVTPAWMRHIYKEHLSIFVQFAVNVMGVTGGLRDLDAVALEGIRRLQAFFTEMGQPSSLAGLGIDGQNLAQMAYKATHWPDGSGKPLGGLKKLSEQDALAIYQLAL